jgi:polysaccharide export outer membrane protein
VRPGWGSFRKIFRLLRIAIAGVGGLLLTGCGWLPAAGPSTSAVISQGGSGDQSRYTVILVDGAVVNRLLSRPAPSLQSLFGSDAPPPMTTIAVGDTVNVAVWEAGGSTLFGDASMATPLAAAALPVPVSARPASIPDQVVMTDGAITIPFAGRIPVAGQTPQAVQDRIRNSLKGKASDPQVIVTVSRSVFNSITVTGEVVSGGRIPVSPRGDRILDVIAAAGGMKAAISDTSVRLTRNGVTAGVPLSNLIEQPKENIYVWPGDVLTLIHQPRSFQAFGATGRNDEIEFGRESLNLSQALAKAAGLQDQRADPAGVFVLRYEPRALVRELTPAPPPGQDQMVPVVYRFDFDDPRAYFLAERFAVQDKDIIYVSNAPTGGIQKFFQLFGTLTAPVVTGAAVNNSVH